MHRLASVAVGLAIILAACVTTGPGGETSLIVIPTSQEVTIGKAMAAELAVTEKELSDPEWQAYLNEVGQKIVAVCDRKDITYQFRVIESDQINAFAAPGGYIYFYTGLLKMMDTEAELAAVVAHEISHVVARHGIKRLQAAMGVSLAYELAMGDRAGETLEAAVSVGMGLLFASYSRGSERQADDYGMTYMLKAGYNPLAMETMFAKLAASGTETNAFEKLISSHPDSQERIRNARNHLARLQPLSPGLRVGRDRYHRMLARLPSGP